MTEIVSKRTDRNIQIWWNSFCQNIFNNFLNKLSLRPAGSCHHNIILMYASNFTNLAEWIRPCHNQHQKTIFFFWHKKIMKKLHCRNSVRSCYNCIFIMIGVCSFTYIFGYEHLTIYVEICECIKFTINLKKTKQSRSILIT